MKLIDRTGQKFGRLTVLKRVQNIGKETGWLCRCECGVEVTAQANNLKSGNTTSCGCRQDEARKERLIDLTGEVFGWLTVTGPAPKRGKQTVWRCRCECGNVKDINAASLRGGQTKSCGCKVAELVSKARRKPNRRSRTYSIWINIKSRCRNPNVPAYPNYGGRGIDICDEWAESFDAFFEAVGEPTSPNHEIDRIDNNAGYRPGNVRWTTRRVNANNKRTTVRVTYNGTTKTISEWSAIYGIPAFNIRTRLKLGWPMEKALTTPVRHR